MRLLLNSGSAWLLGPLLALALNATVGRADPREIELLHNVPSSIDVSSMVRNSSDRPEHLVDGSFSTAWNSRTGSLRGAWIAFKVPAEVRVSSIMLTVGYTHKDARGDFFTMNHRIKSVALFRDEKLVGHFALDPSSRALQTIPVGQPGGNYRIEVEETLPGSKPRWQEVCVTEIQVWGTVPPGFQTKLQSPAITVAGQPPEPIDTEKADAAIDVQPGMLSQGLARVLGPYPNMEAFCRRWERVLAPILTNEKLIYPPASPYCSPTSSIDAQVSTQLTAPPPPLVGAQIFDAKDESAGVVGLALRKADGFYLIGLFSDGGYDDPGCSGSTKWQLRGFSATGRGGSAQVVVRYRVKRLDRQFDDQMHVTGETNTKSDITVTCTVPERGLPSCTQNKP